MSLTQIDFFDGNILIGDDLCLFEHGFDGATLLLGGDLKLLVYLGEWKLYEYACLIRQQDVVLFEALLFLDELISHTRKSAVFQLHRQVFLNVEVNVPMLSCPLHEVKLILVGKENEEIVGGLVVEVEDESFLMLPVILGEDELEAALNCVLVILHLVDQLVGSEEGEGLGVCAESGLTDGRKPFQENSINEVEVIILVISDLGYCVLAYNHQVLHVVIIETTDCLIDIHLLLVTAILPLSHLFLLVYLIQVELVIQDEERCLSAHKKAEVLIEIGAVHAVTLAYFATEEREGDDLVVD